MEKKKMEQSRLFGAAVAKVRNPDPPSVRSRRMRSDAALSSSHRAIMKIGGRASSRMVIVSDPSLSSLYGAIRGGSRRSYRRAAEPYASNQRRLSPTQQARSSGAVLESYDDAGQWQHDLFDGDVSSNPGSIAFVRNLPTSITQQQLVKLFSGVGDVASVKIDLGPLTTARIAFVKKSSAGEAAKQLHGYKLYNRAIKVSEFISLDAQDRERREAVGRGDDYDIDMRLSQKRPSLSAYQHPTANHNQERFVLMSDAPQKSVFDRLG